MICDQCQNQIASGDEREHLGKTLCEDCYLDILSPVKACDPWAVYTAKSTASGRTQLTHVQEKLLAILEASDGMEMKLLTQRLGLDTKEVERELATLRHMEKIRATKQDGQIIFRRW